jgi:hypothetical protein
VQFRNSREEPGPRTEKITLSVELPVELVHDVAALEQRREELGPSQTYRALVRTRAKAAGKVSLRGRDLPDRPVAKSSDD